MDETFHYLVMANQALVQKRLLAGLKGTGLSLGQPKVLDYLKDREGCSQKELAAGCHIEPATLTSVLGRMEEKGLIERKSLNGNRRSLYVYLTEEGRRLQEIVLKEFDALEEDAFEGISPEEKKILMDLMEKIYENLL